MDLEVSMNFLDQETFPAFAKKCQKWTPLCAMLSGAGEQVRGAVADETHASSRHVTLY